MLRALRWGDNDRYFGPFTWSRSKDYSCWAVVLKSCGDDDVENGICSLRISLRKTVLIIAMPGIVRPWREKVYPQWDAETVKRLGRDWYWNVDPRQYGFSLNDGHLSIYYGRTGGSACDSSIEQRWGYFLPWMQWRHVRHSFYGLHGEHLYDEPQTVMRLGDDWKARRAREEAVPTAAFTFMDFDGEELTATTKIEEREWRFGAGYFRWLSIFRRPMVKRSLDIWFSGETGPEKGSWKGGTIGTSIGMLPGETHEAAFRRYCEEEHRSKYSNYSVKFLSCVPLGAPRNDKDARSDKHEGNS